MKAGYRQVDVALIDRNPDQPRKTFCPVALAELTESIRTTGLLQAVTLRPTADGRYQIIAGERRWRASREAGLMKVPSRIVTGLDDTEAYERSVLENVVRVDMTPMEEAHAYQRLLDDGRTLADVAAIVGKHVDTIRWRLGLLTLTAESQDRVSDGTLKPLVAYYVARLSPANQTHVLTRYMRGGFASEADAVDFAQALEAQEHQPVMFGEPDTEQAKAERTARRRQALSGLDRIAGLAQELERLAAADPTDLALALGADAGAQLARLEDVYQLSLKARRVVRKAVAAVAASDTHARNA